MQGRGSGRHARKSYVKEMPYAWRKRKMWVCTSFTIYCGILFENECLWYLYYLAHDLFGQYLHNMFMFLYESFIIPSLLFENSQKFIVCVTR